VRLQISPDDLREPAVNVMLVQVGALVAVSGKVGQQAGGRVPGVARPFEIVDVLRRCLGHRKGTKQVLDLAVHNSG